MVARSSRLKLKDARGFYLISAILVTFAMVGVAIAMTITTYINWQHQAMLTNQQAQQHLEQLYWSSLNQAETFAQQQNHSACLQKLAEVPENSEFYERSQALAKVCYAPLAQKWFDEAEKLSAQGKLKEAITIAGQIKEGAMKAEAQQRITLWSQTILELAEQRYYSPKNQYDEAIVMARAIPSYSSLYGTSQITIQAWQKEWFANQQFYQSAAQYLQVGDLVAAAQSAEKMSQHPFWATQSSQILLDIQKAEQQFQQIVYQAEQYIAQGQTQKALHLIEQLPNASPWHTHKLSLIEHIQTTQQHNKWLPIIFALGITMILGFIFQSVATARKSH
jgi:hypothetical protein